MKKKPTRIISPASYEIPAHFSREAGRIIVRFAHLEHQVRRLTWEALGVGVEIGRLAVRDPIMEDHLDMLQDIAQLKGFPLPKKALELLKGRINELSKYRNLVCHGLWLKAPNSWYLQHTSGTYPKDYEAEHRKRRVNPEAIRVTIEGLRSVSDGIALLIEDVATLRGHISGRLAALPEKCP